nr:helix-turn-helix domain-containing protein [Mesorhizobium camelthorni]
MGRRETGVMDERLLFVAACLEDEETMTGLCAAHGISRKTGYKWLGRYRELGPEGLRDLPRAPLVHGRATPAAVVDRIVAEKEAHPQWGPKKIVARLSRQELATAWPSASTAGAILARRGLVGRRRARWKGAGNGPWPEPEAPNAVWTGDHKGWFRTRDGWRCEPLTVMDARSRYLLALEATGSTGEAEAWPVFERLFGEHGLPERIRSDNGPPFAAAGVTGLTPLSLRFVRLGIALERIDPGKPQQNGKHAAAGKSAGARPGGAGRSLRGVPPRLQPHEALGMDTPAEHYRPSTRPMPASAPEPDYLAEAAVRKVRHNGAVKWRGGEIYVAATLAGEPVAIEETEAGEWAMRFYAHRLGFIDEKHGRLVRKTALQPRPAAGFADQQGGKL